MKIQICASHVPASINKKASIMLYIKAIDKVLWLLRQGSNLTFLIQSQICNSLSRYTENPNFFVIFVMCQVLSQIIAYSL